MDFIYAYSNYELEGLGAIWWAILILIGDDRASEKPDPAC